MTHDKPENNRPDMFTPPFCPNPKCPAHEPKKHSINHVRKKWFVRRGIKNDIQQYICKHCSRSFSESTFQLGYYEKVTLSYKKILANCTEDITLEHWSTLMETTAPTLKLRLHKLLWILVDQLDHRIKTGIFQGNWNKSTELLVECHRLYGQHRRQTYRILRDLILRFKRLLSRRISKAGRRLLHSKLEENLLRTVREIIGRWSYPMGFDFRWFPHHPTE